MANILLKNNSVQRIDNITELISFQEKKNKRLYKSLQRRNRKTKYGRRII